MEVDFKFSWNPADAPRAQDEEDGQRGGRIDFVTTLHFISCLIVQLIDIILSHRYASLCVNLKKCNCFILQIPYKETAMSDLPKVHIPEDAVPIKHAQEAGKLFSDVSRNCDQ